MKTATKKNSKWFKSHRSFKIGFYQVPWFHYLNKSMYLINIHEDFITINSNISFFIFQLICILAKTVLSFELDGFFFSRGFRCCTQENKFCHLSYVLYSALGTLKYKNCVF